MARPQMAVNLVFTGALAWGGRRLGGWGLRLAWPVLAWLWRLVVLLLWRPSGWVHLPLSALLGLLTGRQASVWPYPLVAWLTGGRREECCCRTRCPACGARAARLRPCAHSRASAWRA
jgi:hypothetical protein